LTGSSASLRFPDAHEFLLLLQVFRVTGHWRQNAPISLRNTVF
jgi:hypothetical protein